MSSKTEHSGPIRFVGGPLHNQIINIVQRSGCWPPYISAPVQPKLSPVLSFADMESQPLTFTIAEYSLERVWCVLSHRGALKFWEYHHTEMDANHAVSSGGDGVCTHMKITRRS